MGDDKMLDLSRRSILGGMLSILAASTTQIIPAPLRALSGNSIPRIYADGKNYDSEGFQALFDGADVIIPSDKLQVTGAKGLIFHRGTFVIDREIFTNGCKIEIEKAIFDGTMLPWWEAFFSHRSREDAKQLLGNAKWLRSVGDIAIDIGGQQFSIANTHMSDHNRQRSGGYYSRGGEFWASKEMLQREGEF
jgi:hypothetical protein